MDTASRRRNAHGSESELKRLCYQWHRWYGRDVITQKSTGIYAPFTYACRLAEEKDSVLLLIPQWMFDAAACGAMRIDPTPQVDYTTLRGLQALLRDLRGPVALPVVKPHPSQLDHGDGNGNKPKKKPVRAAHAVLRKSHATSSVAPSERGKPRRDSAASGADSSRSARSRKGTSKRRISR
jgi:hypothetical protein